MIFYSLVDQLKMDAPYGVQDISVFPYFWRPVKFLVIWMLQTFSLGLKIAPVQKWSMGFLCLEQGKPMIF